MQCAAMSQQQAFPRSGSSISSDERLARIMQADFDAESALIRYREAQANGAKLQYPEHRGNDGAGRMGPIDYRPRRVGDQPAPPTSARQQRKPRRGGQGEPLSPGQELYPATRRYVASMAPPASKMEPSPYSSSSSAKKEPLVQASSGRKARERGAWKGAGASWNDVVEALERPQVITRDQNRDRSFQLLQEPSVKGVEASQDGVLRRNSSSTFLVEDPSSSSSSDPNSGRYAWADQDGLTDEELPRQRSIRTTAGPAEAWGPRQPGVPGAEQERYTWQEQEGPTRGRARSAPERAENGHARGADGQSVQSQSMQSQGPQGQHAQGQSVQEGRIQAQGMQGLPQPPTAPVRSSQTAAPSQGFPNNSGIVSQPPAPSQGFPYEGAMDNRAVQEQVNEAAALSLVMHELGGPPPPANGHVSSQWRHPNPLTAPIGGAPCVLPTPAHGVRPTDSMPPAVGVSQGYAMVPGYSPAILQAPAPPASYYAPTGMTASAVPAQAQRAEPAPAAIPGPVHAGIPSHGYVNGFSQGAFPGPAPAAGGASHGYVSGSAVPTAPGGPSATLNAPAQAWGMQAHQPVPGTVTYLTPQAPAPPASYGATGMTASAVPPQAWAGHHPQGPVAVPMLAPPRPLPPATHRGVGWETEEEPARGRQRERQGALEKERERAVQQQRQREQGREDDRERRQERERERAWEREQERAWEREQEREWERGQQRGEGGRNAEEANEAAALSVVMQELGLDSSPSFSRHRQQSMRHRLGRLESIPHVMRVNSIVRPTQEEELTEHQRLQRNLQQYALKELSMDGDGNCQFRALADQLYGNAKKHTSVRKAVVSQMKQYSDRYAAYVPDSYSDYVKSMSKNGTWGDHVTLQAAADKYNAKITLITSFKEKFVVEIVPRASRPRLDLWLSYYAECHYNSVYPKEVPIGKAHSGGKKHWLGDFGLW